MGLLASGGRNPEEAAYDRELAGVLESAILGLSEDQRLAFILRDVEGMSTDETAACLNITPDNVKIRLHRARAALRRQLYARAGATTVKSFQFHAPRCDRVVKNVFKALGFPEYGEKHIKGASADIS